MSIFTRKTKQTKSRATEPEVQVAKTQEKAVVAKKKVAKAKSSKAVDVAAVPAVKALAEVSRTLLSPLVTEKSAHLADQGIYAFLVPVNANRVTIGQAFRELYKVTPAKVNIVRVHGKEHRFGRVVSRQSDWKKALISVPKGTRIDIFEKI